MHTVCAVFELAGFPIRRDLGVGLFLFFYFEQNFVLRRRRRH